MNRGFDRALSDGDVLRRRASFLQRIHIDGWLLFLLLILGAIGLFVLYSAGGRGQGLAGRPRNGRRKGPQRAWHGQAE